MADQQKPNEDDRTGKYGGDDGALEHEREEIQPGEDTGMASTPAKTAPPTGKSQAEQKQDQDLKTGEENPA